MTRFSTAWVLLAGISLAACGPTVGDACTVDDDCSAGVCLNAAFTPGGYCSQSCALGDAQSCPTGSVCVEDVLPEREPGCLSSCERNDDCRDGYLCRDTGASKGKVCVGTEGF